jgi:hypothetical protein
MRSRALGRLPFCLTLEAEAESFRLHGRGVQVLGRKASELIDNNAFQAVGLSPIGTCPLICLVS